MNKFKTNKIMIIFLNKDRNLRLQSFLLLKAIIARNWSNRKISSHVTVYFNEEIKKGVFYMFKSDIQLYLVKYLINIHDN
jgi:hypothetical protein